MDLMAPVFNQALKAGHVGFITDTYIQCIRSSLWSLTNILADDNLGVLSNNGVCKKKVQLLNVDSIGQNMREEIYSNTLFNRLWHYQCADVLVPRKGYSYQTDREPLPH